ncbi:MAG: AAA family ATPase [Desulfobacterales bacterium]
MPIENKIKHMEKQTPGEVSVQHEPRRFFAAGGVLAITVVRPVGHHKATGVESADKQQLPAESNRIVYLKERSLNMLKNDLILRNPLRFMQKDPQNSLLPVGGFGAVLARAGVGKTALLVQISLNSLLEGWNVLHISLEDPVDKVNLWYTEVFNHIARQYNVKPANELWDTLLPHRFIMTFRVEGFSVPKLDERLTDLIEQNIFTPHVIILDGLPFDQTVRPPLLELKELTQRRGCHAWFTVRTHRHEMTDPKGIPAQMAGLVDLFDVILYLQPQDKDIHIRALKGQENVGEQTGLILDPATMLITETS